MASSSSRRREKPGSPAATSEARDWAAGLPRDILVDVFLKLGPCREIMRGAGRVCTAWLRVAVDEPLLWHRIDFPTKEMSSTPRRRAMARAVVDRSRGQCEAFSGHVDKDSLLYLAESDGNLFKSVCQASPHLEKLRVTLPEVTDSDFDSDSSELNDGKLCEISAMCKLRVLELFEFELTTEGLTAILDNCPLLESLHVTGSFLEFDEMDEELQAKCAKVKNLILPDDEDECDPFDLYGEPWGWENS
ncbi:hypothetical protein EJB05_09639 [Eragrostis curvula]|uniref:F-box domain-containing protein n=1 Tax=Eragrostis curvula TaxID=38414 RepID=A0A5J9W5H9_9POAL|nr:hypothetical protein EJB05_09639 [Eragrostis curvula]